MRKKSCHMQFVLQPLNIAFNLMRVFVCMCVQLCLRRWSGFALEFQKYSALPGDKALKSSWFKKQMLHAVTIVLLYFGIQNPFPELNVYFFFK